MKDLRSYHNALGAEALAALVTDPANFTVVEPAAATLSTAPPGGEIAITITGPAATGSAVDFTDLDARRIHLEHPPPQPVPVFSLLSQQICTAGNLTVISAQAKGGKSAVVGAMIASIMAAVEPKAEEDDDLPDDEPEHDLLGFTAAAHAGRAVVLFDTEQSPYDAWNLVHRSAQRAGVSAMPGTFRGYSLADVSTEKRRAYLAAEMQRAQEECGGIHSVFIDGVADLCKSPNDDIEAFALVEQLAQLAIAHACPIILVLHENPSGFETGKTRGHLGSQLERKAESNLRIAKDGKSGASIIFSERCRHACISRDDALRFAWSVPDGMHMTVEAETKESRTETARQNEQPECQAVFAGHVGEISYGEMKQRIMINAHVAERSAKRRIKQWLSIGLIKQVATGSYLRC
ncbi:MAG: AAA family ATPase [Prosthecobacter sp.]|uniref:hypothetical protein n=1 Tax=Prosthecobacter sp. TaxID=1965333 RepID=UPI002631DD6F|nr:hypothetical protein [Prosthecobacter sp.]MCF7788568.1 AAA family ATPase [Prosthecobacter sp.]